MASHSSILVWEIPWTEEPGRPQFMESQKSDTTEQLNNNNNNNNNKNRIPPFLSYLICFKYSCINLK